MIAAMAWKVQVAIWRREITKEMAQKICKECVNIGNDLEKGNDKGNGIEKI